MVFGKKPEETDAKVNVDGQAIKNVKSFRKTSSVPLLIFRSISAEVSLSKVTIVSRSLPLYSLVVFVCEYSSSWLYIKYKYYVHCVHDTITSISVSAFGLDPIYYQIFLTQWLRLLRVVNRRSAIITTCVIYSV